MTRSALMAVECHKCGTSHVNAKGLPRDLLFKFWRRHHGHAITTHSLDKIVRRYAGELRKGLWSNVHTKT